MGRIIGIGEFDLYYQDVQKRIKDQQYVNQDFLHQKKIDIVIVVDMLLTGFDSKYLNTLYVDKNLKYHGLIQAFSRTNRVLNSTKPYGNIIDFWGLEEATDVAIRLFSGKVESKKAKEIWLVESAYDMIEKLEDAVLELETFMKMQELEVKPCEVNNLKGDEARLKFIKTFKDVQRIRNNLDLYTGLKEEDVARINKILPRNDLRAWQGAYLNLADKMRVKKMGMCESEIMEGYKRFRDKKNFRELERIACNAGLGVESLKAFVDKVLKGQVFDGDGFSDLLRELNLGWKERVEKEWEVMETLAPLLKKMSGGLEIRGLSAYEKR